MSKYLPKKGHHNDGAHVICPFLFKSFYICTVFLVDIGMRIYSNKERATFIIKCPFLVGRKTTKEKV